MGKKTYITPNIKVRSINNESLLATASQEQEVSGEPAKEPGHSKENHSFDNESEASMPVYNVWE